MEHDGIYLNDSVSSRVCAAHFVSPSRLCLCLSVLCLARVYIFNGSCLCHVQRVLFVRLLVFMLCLFRVYSHIMFVCVRVDVLSVPI